MKKLLHIICCLAAFNPFATKLDHLPLPLQKRSILWCKRDASLRGIVLSLSHKSRSVFVSLLQRELTGIIILRAANTVEYYRCTFNLPTLK